MPKSKSRAKSKSSSKSQREMRIKKNLVKKGTVESIDDATITESATIVFEDKGGTFDKELEVGVNSTVSKFPEDNAKFQQNTFSGEIRRTNEQFTIIDNQRVGKYNPETKVIDVKSIDDGQIILFEEFSGKGERLSSLAIIRSQAEFDESELNKLNQGQLRAYVRTNKLEDDIPKFNSFSNKQLRFQIKKFMQKREEETITDKKAEEFDELADKLIVEDRNLSSEDSKALKENNIHVTGSSNIPKGYLPSSSDGFFPYTSTLSGNTYGFYREKNGDIFLIGIRNADDESISDQFSNKEAKEIAVEELNLQSDDFTVDFDYD